MADSDYQADIFIQQGAAKLVGKSGARLDAQEGFQFFMVDTQYLAETLRNFLRSQYTKTVWSDASGSLVSGADVSTPPTLSPAYGIHLFLGDSKQSVTSIDIREASLGDELIIGFWNVDSATGMGSECSLEILQTGINSASIFTMQGSRVSSIFLYNTGLSAGTMSFGEARMKMVCMAEGKWSIVDKTTCVKIQAE